MPQHIWKETEVKYVSVELGKAGRLIGMTEKILCGGCNSKIENEFKMC
jgi:hypothetical protein